MSLTSGRPCSNLNASLALIRHHAHPSCDHRHFDHYGLGTFFDKHRPVHWSSVLRRLSRPVVRLKMPAFVGPNLEFSRPVVRFNNSVAAPRRHIFDSNADLAGTNSRGPRNAP